MQKEKDLNVSDRQKEIESCKIKCISCQEAKELGDKICDEYKKAFEQLKDK